MIRVRGLAFRYGNRPVFSGLDFDVRPGEILGVLGPNGSGKSTLLALIRGMLSPTAGEALLSGRAAHRLPRREVARLVAVVPQVASAAFDYPVREVVAMGRYACLGPLAASSAEDIRAVDRALALTDTLELADRAATTLSGGELQRVALARAVAQRAPVLLLDEMTSHLDMDHTAAAVELVLRLNREEGTTVVQVSHDMDLAAETSDRLLLLGRGGPPVALGAPADVLTAENLAKVYRMDIRVETNPYTGRPRVFPVLGRRAHAGASLRIHVLCGGGSGAELVRRLHLLGCRLSAGPLNLGDSDEALTRALRVETVVDEPFRPISASSLARAGRLAEGCDALVVGPVPWGPGNLACLDLAEQALGRGTPVLLVDPTPERDFTAGEAWKRIEALQGAGAKSVAGVERLLEAAALRR